MIKVVFLATPDIAVNSLKELCKNKDFNVCAVVTQPDRPKGRGNKLTPPPVKVCANDMGIVCYQTEKISKDTELIEKLKEIKPDFLVTFAFGQILSQEVLDIPNFSTINLHASLLPKYRGANPIQRCIYNGDCETGITTMITVLALDAGDICQCEKIPITENMNDIELKEIISEKSPQLICTTLKGLYEGKIIPAKQDEANVTIAKKFNKEDGFINWEKSAREIHNQVRSMLDFPTAYTIFDGKTIKIVETEVLDEDKIFEKAQIINISKLGIEVGTKKGSILIKKVKPESKGVMSAYDYSNGSKIKAGMKFGE